MIGRYERGEVMSSVEVAKKKADVLDTILDYLAGDKTNTTIDKKTLRLIDDIENLGTTLKDKLFYLANAIF